MIYEFVKGNKKYQAEQKYWLYTGILNKIYWKYFKSRFIWNKFKTEHFNFAKTIENTLTPVYFNFWKKDNIYSGRFKSLILPEKVTLQFQFKTDDTSYVGMIK